MTKEYLNSSIPLVHAVTEWLCKKARTTFAGVPALDHLLVLVPTRQAGRRLRESLAEAFPNGCIPPKTLPASTLLQPPQELENPVISRIESIALLAKLLEKADLTDYPALFPSEGHPANQNFTWSLAISVQLHQLWNALEESALCMSDVADRIGELLQDEDLDVEIDRWSDLAKLEKRFFSAIEDQCLTPTPLAAKIAVQSPNLPAECSEIVLPALVDGVPAFYQALNQIPSEISVTALIQFDGDTECAFDNCGVPKPSFWNSTEAPPISIEENCIHPAQESADQAEAIAAYFDSIPDNEALPALGMADANLFNELESAFLNRNIRIHNPAGVPLSSSSLAMLIQQIRSFNKDAPFSLLASFIRQADTARLTGISSDDNARILKALDEVQNAHIPQSVAETLKFCSDELEMLSTANEFKHYEEARVPGLKLLKKTIEDLLSLLAVDPSHSPIDQLIDKLKLFFKGRILTEINTIDRELAAAASKILDLHDSTKTALIQENLSANETSQLFDEMMKNSIYQLEPSSETEILTEGWLELIWNPSREIVISGFNEGSIPMSVVGHAFLPDRLRKAMGMLCNEMRTARDIYLLHALTSTRQRGAVQIHLERVNSTGDVRKPSRLLFKCDDHTLADRAKRLFAESETTPPERPRILPESWKLNLPLPDDKSAPKSLSVSHVSSYLKCPFSFYLEKILNMSSQDDRTEEMNPMVFGSLCHEAIERFGESPLVNSTNSDEISDFLEAQVYTIAKQRFGAPMPAVIQLQTKTAAKRLSFFAEEQAQRTADGWQIAAGEKSLRHSVNGITIRGRADRIDYHPTSKTVQIIDFKTWNKLPSDKGKSKFASRSGSIVEFAEERGMHLYTLDEKDGYALTDMQLPLYMLMMPTKFLKDNNTKIECAYFVLGESRPNCKCLAWNLGQHRQDILEDLHLITESIKNGIYWPPSPQEQWRYNYEKLFLNGPEGEICDAWMSDQEARSARVLKCASARVVYSPS